MPEAVIEVRNLVKEFRADFWKKKVRVLDGVDFTVERGDVFGFLGPNGSGKTSTMKIMVGLNFPTSGEVRLFGKPVNDPAVRKWVGFLPENPYFYDYLKTEEFLGFYADLFGLRGREKEKRIDYLLELVGMDRFRGLQLRKFSKGMLQRIGLAQALVNDPQLVILDEPQTGLDPIGRRDMREIILQLKKQGKTVFFSSHIMPDVEMICEKIGIIIRGKMRDIGRIETLLNPKILYYEVVVSGLEQASIKSLELKEVREAGGDLIIKVADEATLTKLLKKVNEKAAKLKALQPHKETLEDLFMQQVAML